MVALVEIQVSAFTTPTYPIQKAPRRIKSTLVQASNNEDDDRSRPNIVKINTHEQYVKLLEEDYHHLIAIKDIKIIIGDIINTRTY